MATNEEVIQWVRENLQLIQDSCEEEENFEEKHWKKLREIRDYVHEKLSIDTSGWSCDCQNFTEGGII